LKKREKRKEEKNLQLHPGLQQYAFHTPIVEAAFAGVVLRQGVFCQRVTVLPFNRAGHDPPFAAGLGLDGGGDAVRINVPGVLGTFGGGQAPPEFFDWVVVVVFEEGHPVCLVPDGRITSDALIRGRNSKDLEVQRVEYPSVRHVCVLEQVLEGALLLSYGVRVTDGYGEVLDRSGQVQGS
jgi:hypothetical protein